MIWHLPTKFHQNGTTHAKVMTSHQFVMKAAIESEIYFRLRFQWQHSFSNVQIYMHEKIAQSTAEILLLCENRHPPYWNYTSGFYLTYWSSAFWIGVPNFEVSSLTVPEIWRGSQNTRSRSCDLLPTPSDLIFHVTPPNFAFFVSAKLEVSSFSHFQDMEGVPKFQK